MRITTIKKWNLLFIAGIFVMSVFSGCVHTKMNKVGLLLHKQDERWIMDIHYLKEQFSKEGIEFVIKDANSDENLQIKQARELIKEGVRIIMIVAVNQNTAARIVRLAHEHGVEVIGYDRMIKNAELDYLLSYRYDEIGKKQAEFAIQHVPKGNYVLFWGDAFDDNAIEMQKAQMKYLEPSIQNGDINILYKAYIDGWDAKTAQTLLSEIIDFNSNKIDAIVASNDGIAAAVIETLEKYHYPAKVLITGQDATLQSCRFITQGKQSMTIYKPLNAMAMTAAQLCKKIMDNDKIEISGTRSNGRTDVKSVFLEPIVVDRQNLEETVIKDGLHSKEEIFR